MPNGGEAATGGGRKAYEDTNHIANAGESAVQKNTSDALYILSQAAPPPSRAPSPPPRNARRRHLIDAAAAMGGALEAAGGAAHLVAHGAAAAEGQAGAFASATAFDALFLQVRTLGRLATPRQP